MAKPATKKKTEKKEINEKLDPWIEAARALAANRTAIINCPKCQIGKLTGEDQPFGKDQMDYFMFCDTCGRSVLIVPKPQS